MVLKSRLQLNGDIGILILRIFIGTRLLYGVIDNILKWEKMIEFSVFLNNFQFPYPIWSAVLSVTFQFLAAVSILLGYKIRFFAFIMVINFIIALVFVHLPLNDTIEGMTPALTMLFASITFIFTGPGKYSLDYYFSKFSEKRYKALTMEKI